MWQFVKRHTKFSRVMYKTKLSKRLNELPETVLLQKPTAA
jgi:hypothetical protein